jgi:ribosomal protein L11 methylase PrmA
MDNIFVLVFLIILAIILFIFFYWPWLFGAPYDPTSEKKAKKLIKLAKIKKGEKAADLGSGDGRLVIAMAKKGAIAHGYEINPFLVWISQRRIKKAGLSKNAKIHWKSFWGVDLKDYDVVVMFQFPTIMKRLKKKLQKELKPKARIVSYHWKFPSWKPKKVINKDIYLYKK